MRQTAYEPLPTENTNANANIMQIFKMRQIQHKCNTHATQMPHNCNAQATQMRTNATEMQNTYNRNAHTNAQMQLTANLTTSATTINCFALLFSFDFFVC